uniref:Brix domain-containing protein n=1 Tax=Clastoptera arizonana TaxID=38151 RepID=A0A1B6D159_9HEMI
MFTSTQQGSYVRFSRFPRGPTLTFRLQSYCSSREVIALQKKQYAFNKEFKHSPLVVLNSFSGEGAQFKLMTSMFQNMFPTINLNKINLDTVRRCVLFNYNKESKTIDFRHYGIRVAPVGLSRGVKKIVQSKIPNLSKYNDVSDYIMRDDLSESEAEDDPDSHVTLPQKLSSRGNLAASQSAIRLHELGPRLSLQLIKVEDGLLDGEVLFHELVYKTEEEKILINKLREERKRLKEKRKREQEINKAQKEKKKEELKQKSLEGMKKKMPKELESDTLMAKAVNECEEQDDESDSEWYRKEVGEEPDEGLFDGNQTQNRGIKRKFNPAEVMRKRQKFESKKRKETNEFKEKNVSRKSDFKQKGFKGRNKQMPSSRKQGHKKRVIGSKVKKGRRH